VEDLTDKVNGHGEEKPDEIQVRNIADR